MLLDLLLLIVVGIGVVVKCCLDLVFVIVIIVLLDTMMDEFTRLFGFGLPAVAWFCLSVGMVLVFVFVSFSWLVYVCSCRLLCWVCCLAEVVFVLIWVF